MLLLPLLSSLVHDRHDLRARALVTVVVVQESHRIGAARDVASHHRGEVALYKCQVGQVIEGAPLILGIVLTRRQRSVQLLVAQLTVLLEKPVTVFVQFSLKFYAIHEAPLVESTLRRRRIAALITAPLISRRYIVVVTLRVSQDLLVVEVVDVDAHVGNDLCRYVGTFFLHVGDPVVRRVGLTLPVAENQDGERGRRASVSSRQYCELSSS